MAPRTRQFSFLISLVVALALVACESPRKKRAAAASSTGDGLTGGTLVFSDDYDRAEIGGNYQAEGGKWAIRDGRLHIADAHNEGLWLTKPLPRNARVELRAKAHSAGGDLKCEVFAKSPTHQGGYVVIFGGWKNRLNVLARLDEHGKDRREVAGPKVVPNKDHHLVIVRQGKVLSFHVDGKKVLDFDDPDPLTGRFFGFNDWEAPVSFDALRVYDLDGKSP